MSYQFVVSVLSDRHLCHQSIVSVSSVCCQCVVSVLSQTTFRKDFLNIIYSSSLWENIYLGHLTFTCPFLWEIYIYIYMGHIHFACPFLWELFHHLTVISYLNSHWSLNYCSLPSEQEFFSNTDLDIFMIDLYMTLTHKHNQNYW